MATTGTLTPDEHDRVEAPKDVILENRTARRIAIDFKPDVAEHESERFIIPPLCSRIIEASFCEKLELSGWLGRGLVRKSPRVLQARHGGMPLLTLLGLGLVVGILLQHLIQWEWPDRGEFILIGAVILVVAVSLMLSIRRSWWDWFNLWAGHLRDFRTNLMQLIGMLLVAIAAFAVPSWLVVELIAMGEKQQPPLSGMGSSFLVILVLFVGIVSMLPALLYFLFDQQQRDVVEQKFVRDVLRLDPSLQTADDAQASYGALFKEVYGGHKGGWSFFVSFLPVILSTLLLTIGWTATLLPTLKNIQDWTTLEQSGQLYPFFLPHRKAFSFGFLGVYFFALTMLFRRYVRSDLGPKAYSHITMRIIMAILLVWVASVVYQEMAPGQAPSDSVFAQGQSPQGDADAGGVLSRQRTSEQAPEGDAWVVLAVAFLIGIVPEVGVTLILGALSTVKPLFRKLADVFGMEWQEAHPLSRLEGITLYDRARLLEEGIDNIESLAHHNIIELMLRTRIPPARLVDLVDQSILYLHTWSALGMADFESPPEPPASGEANGEKAEDRTKAVQGTRKEMKQARKDMKRAQKKMMRARKVRKEDQLLRLREMGIRTATDLYSAVRKARAHEHSGGTSLPATQNLFLLLGRNHLKIPRLVVIFDAMEDDEWLRQLRYWRENRQMSDVCYSLESFYKEHERKTPRPETSLEASGPGPRYEGEHREAPPATLQ